MDKLRYLSDGFRRKLDDLFLLDENTRFLASAIFGALSSEPCILWGCDFVISGSDIEWQEGVIWMAGEVFVVPEGSATWNAAHQWYFARTTATSRPRTKLSGVTDDHWELRGATFASATVLPSGALPINSDKLIDKIRGKWRNIAGNDCNTYLKFASFSGTNNYTLSNANLPNANVIWYRIIENDCIEIAGSMFEIVTTGPIGLIAPVQAKLILPLPSGVTVEPSFTCTSVGSISKSFVVNVEPAVARCGGTGEIYMDSLVSVNNGDTVFVSFPPMRIKLQS